MRLSGDMVLQHLHQSGLSNACITREQDHLSLTTLGLCPPFQQERDLRFSPDQRGESAWLRNIEAAGGARLDFGHGASSAAYRILPVEEATRVFAEYERRNRLVRPLVNRVLSRLLGWSYDGSPDARRRLAETLPFVAFRPAR